MQPGRKTGLSILFVICSIIAAHAEIRHADDFEGTFNPAGTNEVYDRWYKSGWYDDGYMEPTDEIPARSGSKCLKTVMVKHSPKSRTEIGVNLDQSMGHCWYGFSIYIPDDYTMSELGVSESERAVIAQWGIWEGNGGLPDFALRFSHNKFVITQERDTQDEITLWEGTLARGRWVDWIFHINWTRQSNGAFEAFRDGSKVFEVKDVQTTWGDGDDVKSKIGLYFAGWDNVSSQLSTVHCYYDNYTIASGEDEYDAVDPANDNTTGIAAKGQSGKNLHHDLHSFHRLMDDGHTDIHIRVFTANGRCFSPSHSLAGNGIYSSRSIPAHGRYFLAASNRNESTGVTHYLPVPYKNGIR
ncbi:MAG: hypothetical protein GF401_00370 [Chitinivibrionales bacterium]|nr:hypothetical protein [Chitinivibrionales bacterium]